MGTEVFGLADESGFEEFWGHHREPLRRALALTLGDVTLAEEAVDEAMVRAFERWSRVASLRDPAAWVFRVGLNWARSRLRHLRRRPTRPVEQLDMAVTDPLPDTDLYRAVLGLPEPQRAVLVLRFFLDWPVAWISTALGVPEGTVKSRLHRALGALADREVVS